MWIPTNEMKINEKTLLNSSIRSNFSPYEYQGELNDYMMMGLGIWSIHIDSCILFYESQIERTTACEGGTALSLD